MNSIREPAVAGLMYPGNAVDLRREIQRLLDNAPPTAPTGPIKAIIVPHAGYAYSGAAAAAAYSTLRSQAGTIRRVVLIGTAQRRILHELAIIGVRFFRTPLGDVAQEPKTLYRLLRLPQISCLDSAHWKEHCLEVQLPFLQCLFNKFTVVPILAGDGHVDAIAEVLEQLWGDRETLIVVSDHHQQQWNYATAPYRSTGPAGGAASLACPIGNSAVVQALRLVAGQHGIHAYPCPVVQKPADRESLLYQSWILHQDTTSARSLA